MKIKINITAIILLQLIFHNGAAQNNDLKFNLVEGPNGKPLGKINAVTQDPHGYMWFLGQDEKCIYRYDGNRMVSFRHDDGNPNSLGMTSLETIYADNSGMIWIGGEGLLDQFNPATGIFKHYRHIQNDSGSLSGALVSIILRDHQGILWVGTHNGLDRLDEKTGKFFHYRNEPENLRSLSSNEVRVIYEDHRGVLWIGTGFYWEWQINNEGGLNRLDRNTGTFTRYLNDPKNPHSLINNKVRAIFEDSRGTFWVGTSGDGLHTMDRSTGSFERHLYNPAKPTGLSRPKLQRGSFDHISFINEDNTGAIWIGTNFGGINRYNPVTKKITHFQSGNGFPDSTCWNGFISQDGVLWICTDVSKLLYRVDPFHKSIDSIPTVNQALSFMEDREGYLWVGTSGSGILKFDQHKNLIQQFKYEPSDPFSLYDNIVAAVIQIQEDTIVVGTGNGVRIFNKITQQFSRFHDDGNLNDSAFVVCSKIFQDKQGLIWFGRWGLGLVRYNPKDNSFKHFLSNPEDSTSIGSNQINSILEDRSGVFWVAGQGGIDRLNRETGQFNHYLAGTYIAYLYEDSGGVLWAGTDRGLFQYSQKEDRFTSFFDPQSEINSFTVGGIIEDNAKNLWLTSPSAIIRLNPSTKETFVYGSRFGISPNSLSEWAATYKNGKGQIFIGSPNGFYAFSPEGLSVKTDLKIIITDFFVNTLPVLPGKGSLLQKHVDEISDLDLKYNQNNIAFNFTAIDYRDPETIKYFYMLEGYDREWQEVKEKKENSSYYFNLPVGRYVYRVKAFNSDGTKAEKAITVRIYPAWWNTWLFRIPAIIFIGIIFYGFMRWRLKQKFRLQLERSEKEKQLAELNQKATELEMQALRSQMNPHFIFNSLNSINRFILQNNKAQASEYLTKFSKLVRMILQNSQASLITLESELESLQLYLELEALRFDNHFNYAISLSKEVDSEVLKVPPLIIQPFAENAIWHGLMHKEDKGNLNIEITQDNDYLFFKIIDDGIGRMQAAAVASKSATRHKSMGLKITTDRIAMMQRTNNGNSPVLINDLVNSDGSAAGTEVIIKIPLKYD